MPTDEYLAERASLREIFPRGRFVEDGDGTCILRAKRKAFRGDHLFVQARGRLVGVFYLGRPTRYLKRLEGGVLSLVVDHLAGDGEGIIHVRWDPALRDLLPMFSRPQPTDPTGSRLPPPGAKVFSPETRPVEDFDAQLVPTP